MDAKRFYRGSEWRKWDLQLHTPATVLNNRFDGSNETEKWDNFISKIETSNIQAIAVTNYFCIEGYQEIIKRKERGQLSKIELILPNIEFRISQPNRQNDFINLHIIFSDAVKIEAISKFLNRLPIISTSSNGSKLYCNMDDLKKIGFDRALVEFSVLKSKLEEDFVHLKDYLTVCVCRGHGSFRPEAGEGRGAELAVELDKFADIIFGKREDVAFFLDTGRHDHAVKKPVVDTSDAHCLGDVDSKFTWIKADPTFEGLKQIIYESEDRVYIGEEPPSKIDKSKIIKSITISSSNRWFEDNKPFELNEGLVSIIGGKGTGKTALIDLLAYAAQSYRRYRKKGGESKSFLEKAFKELKGVTIKLQWADGRPDEKEVGDKLEDFIEEGKVRYLPQDFIEELCTELGKENLEKQIENVIFQNISKEYKANYSDFSSYKNAQIKVINDKKKRVAEQIKEINSKIFEITELMTAKDKKKNEIIEIEKEISKLDEEMNKISSSIKDADDQKKIITDLSNINDKKTNIEQEISGLNTKLLKIDDVKNKIFVFAEYAEGFVEEVKGELKSIQIPQEVIESIKVKLEPDNIENLLDNKKQEIAKEIGTKKKELDGYNENIQGLNKNLKLEKTKQDKIKEINSSLSQQKEKLSSLKEGFKNIEESEKSLHGLFNKRKSLFINFFEILFEEKEKLKAIYSPLENILKQSAEENERLFDFSVQFSFDVKEIAEKGDRFIDHTKEGRFWRKTEQALISEIEQLKFYLNLEDEVISSGDKETVKKFLLNVENLFLKDENGREFKISAQLKKGTEKDFYDWLYSTDYYRVIYSIRFNDTDIDNLSPGLKGVALLVLYLDLDKEDTRPILIDQPEENLDNRSVYKTLRGYFREAKRNRQVIIVTHNPNIVVNTDSEQVIVADFDRGLTKQQSRIYYVSGSLENTFKSESNIDLEKQGIREHVCEILEGGKEAFEKREKKYGFKS